ncbi:prepilin-type N-terminal cleavage/methylation domain-containing protein [Halobacillus sp. Marseille-Q1614]|uniref:prepilin-type N-terminal cleavage/methylation domain-containing protein n=1 Tax=Halobacillus sp. Marseille-Q1614 TaxID=2709134 RepID=UPI00156EE9C7|nr:prepilin-type N-terminal cleavage/methylation domain-containing protein [Halobacillus sp. Marseille-Q1614]
MNNKGFTLIEVISAFGLLMIIILFTLPSLSQLRMEQKYLSIERSTILKLEKKISELNSDASYPFSVKDERVEYEFFLSSDYIEGCAVWEGYRDQKKEICMYSPLQ